MKVLASALLLASFFPAPSWVVRKGSDSFQGTQFTQYTLTGRFLAAPQNSQIPAPLLVMECEPGHHSAGYHIYRNGNIYSARIIVGTILDAHLRGVPVQYRLDGGKIHYEVWNRSTDFTALYPNVPTLDNLFYGHLVPHKAHTSAPVKSITIQVPEDVAGNIVMQFDLPNDQSAEDACGLVVHKS